MVEVMLGFVSLEENPLYQGNVFVAMYSLRILYYVRGNYERNKRKLQWVCCRLYPFICWIIKMKDLAISLVDVAHTRWTAYIGVSIVLCIFYVLFPHLFLFYFSTILFL